MTEPPPTRPVPVPDEQSAPFWAATAAGVLALARCGRCRSFTHPPAPVCPHCGDTDPGWGFEPVAPRGSIRSWTVLRQSFLPGFEVPFVLVDVAIEDRDDLRLIGRLLDGPEAPLGIGEPVDVAFERLADGSAVPAFSLAGR